MVHTPRSPAWTPITAYRIIIQAISRFRSFLQQGDVINHIDRSLLFDGFGNELPGQTSVFSMFSRASSTFSAKTDLPLRKAVLFLAEEPHLPASILPQLSAQSLHENVHVNRVEELFFIGAMVTLTVTGRSALRRFQRESLGSRGMCGREVVRLKSTLKVYPSREPGGQPQA